jgi:hypothetical protein
MIRAVFVQMYAILPSNLVSMRLKVDKAKEARLSPTAPPNLAETGRAAVTGIQMAEIG